MIKQPQWRFRLPRHSVMVGAIIFLWFALFLGGAMPAWKKARHNEEKIASASSRLASLNQWSVAGIWLTEEIREWEPIQNESYDRLFPESKGREDLFLDLVRIANENGIDPIRILEAPQAFRPGTEQWHDDYDPTEEMDDEAMEIEMLISEFAPDLSALPKDELIAHRALVSFTTGYSELASFLDGLRTIPRALSMHRLIATSMDDGVEVRMELDFYVQKQD
jgi:hypothetical protein